MNDWWYESRGERHGPMTQAALQELVSAGRIGRDTAVWSRSTRAWQPLRRHAQFSFRHAHAPLADADAPAGRRARAVARSFDLSWEILLLAWVGGVAAGLAPPSLFDHWLGTREAGILLAFECVPAALLFDAVVAAVFENTPGKALLGLRVVHADGRRFGFMDHVRRNLRLWYAGYGLGLPVVVLFTLAHQYALLGNGGQASYDGKAVRVLAEPVGLGRRLAFGLAFVLVWAATAGVGALDVLDPQVAHGAATPRAGAVAGT